jgi:hypothetical protein
LNQKWLVRTAWQDSNQISPALTLGKQRDLHLVWIERQSEFGFTRLY